jgi:hypothetical protein
LKPVYLALAIALTAVVAALLTCNAQSTNTLIVSNQTTNCPPGALVVNSTGTFICAFEVANYTPVFISLYLSQEEGNFTGILTCLDSSGCRVNVTIYDYYNNTLNTIGNLNTAINAGENIAWNYTVNGRGVVEIYVNDVFMGYYVAQVVSYPTAVPSTLKDLAGQHPLLTVIIGLLVVGTPLGWILQREFGLAGLALAGASMLIYVLTRALTGSDPVAIALAVVSGLIGVVFIVMHGGQP